MKGQHEQRQNGPKGISPAHRARCARRRSGRRRDARAQGAVPNSEGTESPKLKAPANACDCHMHIYDPARFPMVPSQRVPPTMRPGRVPATATADRDGARGGGDAAKLRDRQ